MLHVVMSTQNLTHFDQQQYWNDDIGPTTCPEFDERPILSVMQM